MEFNEVSNNNALIFGFIGGFLNLLLYFNSPSIFELILHGLTGFIVFTIFYTGLYHVLKRLNLESRYLKIFSIFAVFIFLSIGSLTPLLLTKNFSCLMYNPVEVKNKFTGKTKTINIACDSTESIAWYYKVIDENPNKVQVNLLKSRCSQEYINKVKLPSGLDPEDLPDKYKYEDGTVICP